MVGVDWLNVILWLVDTFLVLTIFFIYFLFAKFYHQWQVWPINSPHDNISSSDWFKTIKTYQQQFQLEDYQIDFVTNKNYRLFSNLNRSSKKIILTSWIFPSVGYELNYLVSRLWISQKQLERNPLVVLYWWLTKILPWILLALVFLLYFAQTTLLFLGMSNGGSFRDGFFRLLWDSSLLGFLIIFLVAWWMINYYLAATIKRQIHQMYLKEITPTLSQNLNYFEFDFKAALQYDVAIWIPYSLVWTNNSQKWLGALVY